MSDTENQPDFVAHRKFSIPRSLLEKSGPVDQADQIADAHVAALRRFAGLNTARWVMEIGCGFGLNAIDVMEQFPMDARYVGVDVDEQAIDWAQKNITSKTANFWFHPLDQALFEDDKPFLPAQSASIELVYGFGVFHSIYPDGFSRYLSEVSRVLRPGGSVFLTLYVIRPGLITHLSAKGGNSETDLRFIHLVDRGFYLNDPADKNSATGFSERKLGAMARRARLVPTRLIKGGWSNDGVGEIDGPDALILTKPVF